MIATCTTVTIPHLGSLEHVTEEHIDSPVQYGLHDAQICSTVRNYVSQVCVSFTMALTSYRAANYAIEQRIDSPSEYFATASVQIGAGAHALDLAATTLDIVGSYMCKYRIDYSETIS